MGLLTIPPYKPAVPSAPDVNDPQSAVAQVQQSLPGRSQPVPPLYGPFQVPWDPAVIDYDEGTGTWTVIGLAGQGEIQAFDAVWINGEAPVGGVSYNLYTGTENQGVDPLMAAANASWDLPLIYTDHDGNRVGIAYIALQWTNTDYTSWPDVVLEGRGRKVYDPRTGLTAYSDNASLCTADLIRDPINGYGDAVNDNSLANAADTNDSGFELGAGVPPAKRRIGMAIGRRRKTEQWLEVMRMYAACWLNKRGDTWHFRMDSNTSADAIITPDDQWAGREVEIGRAREQDVPTQVVITYTDDTPNIWVTRPYAYPETLPAGTPRRVSEVNMEGIRGFENAARNAVERYNKLQTQSRTITWYGLPEQLEREQGDAILFSHPSLHEQRFLRVSDKPVQIAPGRWRIPCVALDNGDYSRPPAGAITAPSGVTQPKFIGG